MLSTHIAWGWTDRQCVITGDNIQQRERDSGCQEMGVASYGDSALQNKVLLTAKVIWPSVMDNTVLFYLSLCVPESLGAFGLLEAKQVRL